MKNYILSVLIALGFLTPVFASAQLTGDVAPSSSGSSCLSLSFNLFRGSRDASTNGQVSDLQDFLQTKGYLSTDPTGYFGLLTYNAVRAFQSAQGVLSSGYVGPITRAKISSLSCSNNTGATSAATSLPVITVPVVCSPGALFNYQTGSPCSTSTYVCTDDVKLCPDGSYVSRSGPSCTFAACPSSTTIDNILPDLISQALQLSASTLNQGQSATFTAEVKNQSTVAQAPSGYVDTFYYRWSPSSTWIPLNTTGARGTTAATGKFLDTSSSVNLNQSGTLQIQHCIDTNSVVSESDERNNCISASFSISNGAIPVPALSACNLDVDGNGSKDALTDGLLITRYLNSYRGSQLVSGAIGSGATRTSSTDIETFIASHNFDVDGNNAVSPLSDGQLISRYLFGLSGSSLISGAVGSGATRTTADQLTVWLNACTPITLDSTPAPTVSVSAPTSVIAGQTVTVSWTSTYATSCSSQIGGSGLGTSGSFSATPTVSPAVYVITCTGASGTGSGQATVTITQPQTTSTLSACNLDIDGNGTKDALTDGLLIKRYLNGTRGDSLISSVIATNATRRDAVSIESYIASHNYDVDGDGTINSLSDGNMILQYLFDPSGSSITTGMIGATAVRKSVSDIVVWLNACGPQVLGAQKFILSQYTQVGSTGNEVLELQKVLTRLGYYHGELTGYFGVITKAAVISFQAASGLPAEGSVGPLTREKLNSL